MAPAFSSLDMDRKITRSPNCSQVVNDQIANATFCHTVGRRDEGLEVAFLTYKIRRISLESPASLK